MDLVWADTLNEVRCCRDESGGGRLWKRKCVDVDGFEDVFARSKIGDECLEMDFYDAYEVCRKAGGRLCTADEVLSSCTKGTGCRHDHELIWTCSEGGAKCEWNSECCSGECIDGECEPYN
uniref:Uncharacterized protein n=1 Tax=Trieres chinensis TaxID=1514140 RepID=A0A7S2EIE8_TRICV|mmetsp:Transcript_24156/g.48936  ORF Transcript_24156/g.48936 Transcript_24156/m.48936 type:complete len:121 (+) Transcript_24156:1-363(+)